jgi:hypothetical protein
VLEALDELALSEVRLHLFLGAGRQFLSFDI